MGETNTTRYQMTKPDAGELIDVVDHLDDNFDIIDLNLGARHCTSGARPTPVTGMIIFETDTNLYREYTGTFWRVLNPTEALTIVYRNAGLAHGTSNSFLDIPWDNEVVDSLGWHSTTVNSERITPTIAGYYKVHVVFGFVGSATGRVGAAFQKNGATTYFGTLLANNSAGVEIESSAIIDCNGTTDYITAQGFQATGVAHSYLAGLDRMRFECNLLKQTG